MHSPTPLKFREYGSCGPPIVALHGGPAAPGTAAPIARGLADAFHVYEPWQRASSPAIGPLAVATHVADLREFILTHCPNPAPVLVGESWGAMLALAFAAAHPDLAGPLVLVGCGTWNIETRGLLHATLEKRIGDDPALREAIDQLAIEFKDGPEQLAIRRYELTHRLYDYDAIPDQPERCVPPFDAKAHHETWDDMLRKQADGTYPAAFRAIQSPVLMIHGDYDPHPGAATRDLLKA